jgi:dienelactone hydrolase
MLRYHETNARKPRSPLDLAAGLTCPYLGLFGADDALIPQADVEELRAKLGAAGKTFEIVSYPGGGPRLPQRHAGGGVSSGGRA